MVVPGLFSGGLSKSGEKEESSKVELRSWLLTALSIERRTELWTTCREPSLLQEEVV